LRNGFKPLLRRKSSDEQQLDLPMHGVKAEHLPMKIVRHAEQAAFWACDSFGRSTRLSAKRQASGV